MSNFIFKLPTWEGKILFNYDTISFFLLLVTLIVGILICFWGYKYFQTLSFMFIASVYGYFAIAVLQGLTNNMILQMAGFILFVFTATSISILVFNILTKIIFTKKITASYQKNIHVISSVLGGAIVGTAVYFNIFRNIFVAIPLAILLFLMGMLHQKKGKKNQIYFKTYEQLQTMKYPNEK